VSAVLPAPMLAVADQRLPHDDAAWAYEMKWDGYRAIVEVLGGHLRIASRRGNDVTAKYPELAGLPDALHGVDAVLDGELVVLDAAGRPSFQAIQHHTAPVVLMCFDVLALDGRDVTGLAWSERRALLERLALSGERWQTPPAVVGDGPRALDTAGRLGLEGIVAKRLDSPYLPGRRSPAWHKIKLHQRQELVVGGWLPGEGRLHGTVGALLVGYYDDRGAQGGRDALHYAGRVGTGFDDRTRDALARSLTRRTTSPFTTTPRLPDPVWVEPDVVVEVRFTEWTTDDVLRQPVFLGIRDDKDATDVVRET
jgi:bifunctional non-homologous end joining protein LigD